MSKFTSALIGATLIAISGVAYAEDAAVQPTTAPAAETMDHAKMTPEEHAAKKAELKQKLDAMTPEERAKYKAEHQEKLKERYDNANTKHQTQMKARQDAHQAHHAAAKGDAAPTEGEAAK